MSSTSYDEVYENFATEIGTVMDIVYEYDLGDDTLISKGYFYANQTSKSMCFDPHQK